MYRAAFTEAFTEAKFPRLHKYISDMMRDEAVKKCYFPPEVHLGVMKRQAVMGKQDFSLMDRTGTGITLYSKKRE